MRYSISSNLKNLSMNWKKLVSYLEKWNFEPIMSWKNPEQKCRLLYVLPKQAASQKKILQLEVYITFKLMILWGTKS